jgi:hypothetical protein
MMNQSLAQKRKNTAKSDSTKAPKPRSSSSTVEKAKVDNARVPKSDTSRVDKTKNQTNNAEKGRVDKPPKRGKNGGSVKKELLPPPNGGIQRIHRRAVFKKRDYPKFSLSAKQSIAETCPICHELVGKDATAIKFDKLQNPAHFQCVIQWLEESTKLEENEKVAYVGAGKFAVVHSTVEKNKPFEVVKYLEFAENSDTLEPIWRRNFAITPELLVCLETNPPKS